MLSEKEYIKAFVELQSLSLEATHLVSENAKAGVSEQQLADIYHAEFNRHGIKDFWYPTLICAGKYSGQPLTRRNHLPSLDVKLSHDDMIILDVTPQQETVWANWTITKTIGDDPFFDQLCADIFMITMETAAMLLQNPIQSLKQIHNFATRKMLSKNLESIEPRGNVGHNIFQVPAGQTVDQTPMDKRLFIDIEDRSFSLPVLLSIEPEFGKINPRNNIRYGGKFQFIVPIGYGEEGRILISDQCKFYGQMVERENKPLLTEAWHTIEPFLLKNEYLTSA